MQSLAYRLISLYGVSALRTVGKIAADGTPPYGPYVLLRFVTELLASSLCPAVYGSCRKVPALSPGAKGDSAGGVFSVNVAHGRGNLCSARLPPLPRSESSILTSVARLNSLPLRPPRRPRIARGRFDVESRHRCHANAPRAVW